MLLGLAPQAASCTGECQKSGPLGLVIIIVLCVGCYFLFKSMSKQLKRVREDFPADPSAGPGPRPGPPSAGPTASIGASAGAPAGDDPAEAEEPATAVAPEPAPPVEATRSTDPPGP